MKERPILFSGEMVRAILEGRKTVTRRVIKLVDYDGSDCYETRDGIMRNVVDLCPYGGPGDRLWVRETWCPGEAIFMKHTGRPATVYYRANDPPMPGMYDGLKWRPSIHMPRWASRITLEITDVRPGRLQEITYDDAIREGIDPSDYPCECSIHECVKIKGQPICEVYRSDDGETAIPVFAMTWDSINGKKQPWASNPWVWRVEFRRVEG